MGFVAILRCFRSLDVVCKRFLPLSPALICYAQESLGSHSGVFLAYACYDSTNSTNRVNTVFETNSANSAFAGSK